MQLMGHSDIETTLRYVHVAPQDVYNEYTRAVAQCMRPVPGYAPREPSTPPSLRTSAACSLHARCRFCAPRSVPQVPVTTWPWCVGSSLIWLPIIPRSTALNCSIAITSSAGWPRCVRRSHRWQSLLGSSSSSLFAVSSTNWPAPTSASNSLASFVARTFRAPAATPASLTAEQDQILQREFCCRNDLGGNVFLLLRHTGMRISECADLSFDCLRSPRPGAWAIHVPLGQAFKKNAWSPSTPSSGDLRIACASFAFDPAPLDQYLLARTSSKNALVRQLRDYLHLVCHSLGLPTNIVPHQTRHTYATEMRRSGVSFPVLMKLLGHLDPETTMRYVDVALTDLEREFQLAPLPPQASRSQPKLPSHLRNQAARAPSMP